MKSLVQSAVLIAFALCPIGTFAADNTAAPAGGDAEPMNTNFSKEVACGGYVDLLSSAPKGTAVSLIAGTCSCKDPRIVLSIIKDNNPRDLCSLEPGEDCLRDIPEGASVSVGITAPEGSGTCKITGQIGP